MIRFRQALHITALAAALAVGVHSATPSVARAEAPLLRTPAPGYYRLMLGDFEVTALSDGTVDLPVDKLLHQPAAKTDAALKRSFLSVPAETSVNAFLVNTGKKLVLIDAGAGTLFGPTLGKLAANLEASGYRPEQVDDIFLTHLHPDHVGGLVSNGARTFVNATVHVEKRDADFWLSRTEMDRAPADSKGFFQGAMASIEPISAAGKLKTFEGASELVPGVTALPSPGHTPGHTSYVIESKGKQLVVMGDLIHVGAVQFDDPTVTIGFDTDAAHAATARAKVFARLAKDGALVAAEHLSFPGLGHLRAAGKSWQWVPVNYTTELK